MMKRLVWFGLLSLSRNFLGEKIKTDTEDC
jgi:hypothetical protein